MANEDGKSLNGDALKYFEQASKECDELKSMIDEIKLQNRASKVDLDNCIKLADRVLNGLDHAREHL